MSDNTIVNCPSKNELEEYKRKGLHPGFQVVCLECGLQVPLNDETYYYGNNNYGSELNYCFIQCLNCEQEVEL